MGLFGPKYTELDAGNEVARLIAERGETFASFVKSANDRIEVTVGEATLYAFVGKPPKAFGLLWFDADGRHDVRSMMESKAMTRESAAQLVQELPAIYARHSADERFSHKVGGKNVIVTPSQALYAEVNEAVERARG